MEFRELMETLFGLQERFPGMRWDVQGSEVVLTLPMSQENAELLAQAREMFAARSEGGA